MIPIAILGSAVYLVRTSLLITDQSCSEYLDFQGLHLAQAKLSNEKYLDEAMDRVKILEDEVERIKAERQHEVVKFKESKKQRWWWS
jgi:hypothetical protein